jgi:hypothetical protein
MKFRVISQLERAEIAHDSEQGRLLCMECDMLRNLIKAKDEYIACYKTGKRPTEKLFAKLEKLIADLGMK